MKLSGFRIALVGLIAMLALAGLLPTPASEEAKAEGPTAATEMIQSS